MNYPDFIQCAGNQIKVNKADYRDGYLIAKRGEYYAVPHYIDSDFSFTEGYNKGREYNEQR